MSNAHAETSEFIHDLAAAGTFDLEQEIEVYKQVIYLLMEQLNEVDMAYINEGLMSWLETDEGKDTILSTHYDEYVVRLRKLLNQKGNIEPMNKSEIVAVPIELFYAIQQAFNQIPNKKLHRDDYPDTYAIASELEKLTRGHSPS